MSRINKLDPYKAGMMFIDKHFPNCDGALLAGSVVRGEATETSDLDIVVFDQRLKSAYRESCIAYGWFIEVFVHNFSSYQDYFKSDCDRARPSLPRMVSEGIVLKEVDMLESIKEEANSLLVNGPTTWSNETINLKRYFLTDTLDDLIGCENRNEELFIVNTLAEQLSEFVLRTNKKWIGVSKWIIRSLRSHDEGFATDFVNALEKYYKTGDKKQIIELTDNALEPYGGRLFDGFSIGKEENMDG